MGNEFVSYEQAVALKQLGFNEHVFCTYNKKKILNFEDDGPNRNSDVITWVSGDTVCSAPLKQQVFRWFREKYNKHSFIELVYNEGVKFDFVLYVDKQEDECIDYGDGPFNTYEEAEDACIDKLIELLKQQDNGI